ncbi:AP-3 complex subunit beta [Ceratobasidium sp. 370]|nr:AP-3 complex subunit beta [Ceratobasidium sp. 370]
MALNSIQENASRLGMRLQESLSEHTRDLALVGRSANAAYFDSAEDKIKQISSQLASNSDRDKLDAMKRLIALVSKGRNVSEFFAQVVLNVASHNLEIRKLVYIYLIRHAASEPDLTLLSINTFQKDLADPNPLIRAMALRVLSAIGVPMTGNVVAMGIKKCAADPSPYVRKAAALAISKCYALDTSHHASLLATLDLLLKNHSPLSVGAVARAFTLLCPHRLDLLHPHYRRLCRVLVDSDEWGQVELLDLLSRYARSMLSRPVEGLKELAEPSQPKENIEKFLDSEATSLDAIDPDLLLLLKCSHNLLYSRSPAVVLSVTRTYWYLAPQSYRHKIIVPLLRLLHVSPEIERVTVENLGIIAQEQPSLLKSHIARFFVRASDTPATKIAKLRILLALVDPANVGVVVSECKDYVYDEDEQFGRAAADAIGRCARAVPDASGQCVAALLTLADSGDGESRSAFAIDSIAEWAPDVLRIMAKRFPTETDAPKLATLNLAAKLLTLNPQAGILQKLASYVFSLARWDASYDVRDRGRWLGGLVRGFLKAEEKESGDGDEEDEGDREAGVVLRPEQVRVVLFEGKTGVVDLPLWKENDETRILASMSLITGVRDLSGVGTGRPLPDWCEEPTDGELRETEDDLKPATPIPTFLSSQNIGGHGGTPKSAAHTPVVLTPSNTAGPSTARGGVPTQDLDSFYAAGDTSEESEEESEEEESGEDDDDEESEGSGDDEDEEEGEDDGDAKLEEQKNETGKGVAHEESDDGLPPRTEAPAHLPPSSSTTPAPVPVEEAVWGTSPH